MGQSKVLVFLLSLSCSQVNSQLRFASIFQDGMVLQREPESAVVFGFGAFLPESYYLTLDCSQDDQEMVERSLSVVVGEDGSWRSEIPPQTAGTLCDLSVVNEGEDIILKQVWRTQGLK